MSVILFNRHIQYITYAYAIAISSLHPNSIGDGSGGGDGGTRGIYIDYIPGTSRHCPDTPKTLPGKLTRYFSSIAILPPETCPRYFPGTSQAPNRSNLFHDIHGELLMGNAVGRVAYLFIVRIGEVEVDSEKDVLLREIGNMGGG